MLDLVDFVVKKLHFGSNGSDFSSVEEVQARLSELQEVLSVATVQYDSHLLLVSLPLSPSHFSPSPSLSLPFSNPFSHFLSRSLSLHLSLSLFLTLHSDLLLSPCHRATLSCYPVPEGITLFSVFDMLTWSGMSDTPHTLSCSHTHIRFDLSLSLIFSLSLSSSLSFHSFSLTSFSISHLKFFKNKTRVTFHKD